MAMQKLMDRAELKDAVSQGELFLPDPGSADDGFG